MTIEIVEGWTGPLDFQLLADAVAVNLTGTTVALILTDKAGAAITLGGTATIFDAANGKVRYSPAAGELTAALSPIAARWKVTDGAGKIVYFPSAVPDVWVVRTP